MGLFDLVEQHHAEWLAPHGLGELATLFVADVPGRRADEAADGVLLHVLAHVERDERRLVAEQELGEGLGELGLAHTGGAQEDERAAGALGVFQAGAGAANALADGADGVFLADDAPVQLAFHVEQLLGLFLGELVHRDAGPDAEHLGDGLFVDLVEQVDAAGLDIGLFRGLLLEQRLLLVAQAPCLFEALFLDGALLGLLHIGELGLDLFQIGRGAHALDTQTAAGLVDEVDGLVGQMAVADVAVGQVGRGDDGLVGDGDPVVRLVLVAHTLQDLDGVGDGGLFHLHRLEAALESGIFLEVLAVLVGGGGADGLQLATGQHRLQDRRSIDGALGGTRTHQGVDLVDEQHDVAAGLDLLQHLLQALLEIAAVAATGDERAEVEGVELLVAQRVGHFVRDDALGEALDDRGLADARLADEHRVVLGAAAEDLHDTLELAIASDHRVELLLAGQLGEVATELVEHLAATLVAGVFLRGTRWRGAGGCRLARLASGALVARQQLDDLLANPAEVGAQLHEHLGGNALALADEAEQDVLGADVVVTQLQCFAQRQFEHLLRAGREGDVARGRRAALADDLLDLAAHGLERNAEGFECLGGDSFTLVDEAEQDVLGADVAVVQETRFLLRQHHHSPSPIGEAFKHVGSVPAVNRCNVAERTDVRHIGRAVRTHSSGHAA